MYLSTNQYEEIFKEANNACETADNNNESKNKDKIQRHGRNFNYFITEPEAETIAITYSFTDKESFWGLSPSISEEDIAKMLFGDNSPFASKKLLESKVDNYRKTNLWVFSKEDVILDIAICKRVMLAFSQHYYTYYIYQRANTRINEILAKIWKDTNIGNHCFDYVDINRKLLYLNESDLESLEFPDGFNKEEHVIRKINGRLPDSVLEELAGEKIYYSIVDSKEKNNDGNVKRVRLVYLYQSNAGESIRNLYSESNQEKGIIDCVSPTFYSGSMARVLRISSERLTGNSNVYQFCFELGIVSYSTHIGLKDPRMNYDSFFFNSDEQKKLKEFDSLELGYQSTLKSKLENNYSKKPEKRTKEQIDAINEYLLSSKYTHAMNVTANIITADGYLLFTKRGRNTWDNNEFYCSANGVIEVFDNRVSYYHKSVDCDVPAIVNSYGNFNGELSRETIAELNFPISNQLWSYYGFCIMGYFKASSPHSFPLHFNILASNTCAYDLKQIRLVSKSAVEKEENDNVFGNKFSFFHIKTSLTGFIKNWENYKDSILDVFLFLFFAYNNNIKEVIKSKSAGELLENAVAGFTFILLLVRLAERLIYWWRSRHGNKRYIKRTIFFKKGENSAKKILSKALWKGTTANPSFQLMIILYYYQCYIAESKH